MSKKHRIGINHILWAVDITAPDAKLQHAVSGALKALTAGKKVAIEPVHVLSSAVAGLPQKVFEQEVGRLERPVETKLRQWVGKVKLRGLVKPSLVIFKGVYLRSDIEALMKHARKRSADVIAVSTRARKGLTRFWLGSFAETLLLHSEVPLFIVNPDSKAPSKYQHILFPTDLSRESKKIFERVTAVAIAIGAELVLYRWIESFDGQAKVALVTSGLSLDTKEEIRESREQLESWAAWAKAQGAAVQIRMDSRKPSATEGILSEAKRLGSVFIALAARSGPLKSVLVGSTVRKVVRQATCPVWVMRG